jgi:superfamily II DNA or RNA helicase
MSNKNEYVDLRNIKGRLFPSWILANFSEYKLKPIEIKEGEDPCKNREITGKNKLLTHQEFIVNYLDYESPQKNLLLYHGMGSGKTIIALSVINNLFKKTPAWNVFILLKATLKNDPWIKDMKNWLSKDVGMNNIIFISYDSPNAHNNFLDEVRKSDIAKSSIYIIDESHNFINNVYSNLGTQGKRAITIYDHIKEDVKKNEHSRVLALSGTPAINNPFELALLFNLLRPNIFPKSEAEFRDLYISNKGVKTINNSMKNNFQRRILGLVSYYIGATPDVFPSWKTIPYDIIMSSYQWDVYKHYEEIEKKIESKIRDFGGSTVYKAFTRQACNFVFPNINQLINGKNRPRPRDFKISENEASQLEQGILDERKSEQTNKYIRALNNFVEGFDNYLKTLQKQDISNKKSINDDVKEINEKYNGNINEYMKIKNVKSNLFQGMYKCSGKMLSIIVNILNSPGPTMVYSNYVKMEGLQIFKMYLKYFGFSLYEGISKGIPGYRFVEYHGGIKYLNRINSQTIFNNPKNIEGKIAKIILVSPAGSEGLNLKNVRQVHIMEPFWQEVIINQAINRASRQCSHADLPMDQRNFVVYRYKSVKETINDESNNILTTDQYIESSAKEKETLNQSFLNAIEEAAVDCELNKAHNKLIKDYSCFQFEESSLFEEPIGPAFRQDLKDDIKLDNGSNSVNSITKQIRVIPIKAVIEQDKNGKRFSNSQNYLFSPERKTVYEKNLKYPIGKVKVDNTDIPVMKDENTYIIDKIIPIPSVNK